MAARNGVRTHAVLAFLLRSGGDNPLFGGDTVERGKLVAHQAFAPLLALHPELESRMDDIAQITVQLGLSVILFDDTATESDDDLRRFLMRWLAPALMPHD